VLQVTAGPPEIVLYDGVTSVLDIFNEWFTVSTVGDGKPLQYYFFLASPSAPGPSFYYIQNKHKADRYARSQKAWSRKRRAIFLAIAYEVSYSVEREGGREGGRARGKLLGREGGRKRGREEGREGGRSGGKLLGREEGRKRGREGGRGGRGLGGDIACFDFESINVAFHSLWPHITPFLSFFSPSPLHSFIPTGGHGQQGGFYRHC